MKDFDVVIAGAGPAGSSAARVLASQGFRVLMLERQRTVAQFIPCAEGISRRMLVTFTPEDPRWIAARVDRVQVWAPEEQTLEVLTPHVGYILERKVFDRYLVNQAVLAGADLQTGATVLRAERQQDGVTVVYQHQGREKRVTARLVIGADGPGSVVGRSLGLNLEMEPREIHRCHQVLLADASIEAERMEIAVGHEVAPGGYAWVFPKDQGLANVGVGILGDQEQARHYTLRFVAQRFPRGRILGELASVVPTGGQRMDLVGDRVMVVGDAARLADPLSGGGIPPALESGKIAGEVAAQALEQDRLDASFLARYPERYWQNNGRYQDLSLRIRDFYLTLNDADLAYLARSLKPVFDGKILSSPDAFSLVRRVLLERPGLMVFLLRKGRKALVDYLQERILGG